MLVIKILEPMKWAKEFGINACNLEVYRPLSWARTAEWDATQGSAFGFTPGFILSPTPWADLVC
jgi:hypothetical protein